MAAAVTSEDALHEMWMRHALRLGRDAARRGEVPVGAVAVRRGRVIAAASNRMERAGDATAHAEMLVLRRAARLMGGWRLSGVTVVVTLEPCPMCAGAMVQARVDACVYGARDPKKGADGSVYTVLRHPAGNHRVAVVEGVLAAECGGLLSDFFAGLRRERRRRDAGRRPGSAAGDGDRRDAGVGDGGTAATQGGEGTDGGEEDHDEASHGGPCWVMPAAARRGHTEDTPGLRS